MPEISAIASWMDNLKLPVRNIEEKYTSSEIYMMGWHSRLQSYNMSKRFKHKALPEKSAGNGAYIDDINPNNVKDLGNAWQLPPSINNGVPIPKKFFNEEGDLDLRRATGPEALAYLRKLGIQISIPFAPV